VILTVGDLSRLAKVLGHVETLGFGVLCVAVLPIGNKDLISWDARVAEVLSLGSALVAEA
jgi:hypothetical protein